MGWIGKAAVAMIVGFMLITVGLVLGNNAIADYDESLTTINSTTNEMTGLGETAPLLGMPIFYAFALPGVICCFAGGAVAWKGITGGGSSRRG